MYLCDAHIHSEFSYDSKSKIDDICKAAVNRGLDEVAITDHYDANIISWRLVPDFDVKGAEAAVEEAREKYPKLKISFGIELGEMCEMPDKTEKILTENNFDFVIGSIHNIPGNTDFYFINFAKMDSYYISRYYDLYLESLLDTVKLNKADSRAHIGYPIRYIKDAGKEYDTSSNKELLSEIFRNMIKNDIALEVNTLGLTRQIKSVLPKETELRMYYDMGGRLLTFGSDAHTPDRVGENIENAHKILKDIGFKSFTVFRNRIPEEKEL